MDAAGFTDAFYTQCLYKRNVRNPYTGDTLLVPCGVCPACRLSKSLLSEDRVYAQSSLSKYCYFLTLTYSTEYLPYFLYSLRDVGNGNVVVDCSFPPDNRLCYRDRPNLKGLHHNLDFEDVFFTCSSDYWSRFVEKSNLSYNGKYPKLKGFVPYLCRDDLTLFCKRLRKNLYNSIGYYGKIHMYSLGEYGPVSFRPHFHLLLFFDDDKIAENLVRCCRESWKFGRSTFDSSRGDAQRYVVSYLNCFVSLPVHLQKVRKFRPFARFSNGFGFDFFSSAVDAGKKGDFFSFLNGKSLPKNCRLTSVRPWSGIEDSCFFRYARTFNLHPSQYLEILRYARGVANLSEIKGMNLYRGSFELVGILGGLAPSEFDDCLRRWEPLRYVFDLCRISYLDLTEASSADKAAKRLYSFFHYCDSYLRIFSLSLRSPDIDWDLIYDNVVLSKLYYNEKQRKSLHDSLQSASDFKSSWSDIWFTSSEKRFKEFRESPLAVGLSYKVDFHTRLRVKHRELNDRNFYFTQYSNYFKT